MATINIQAEVPDLNWDDVDKGGNYCKEMIDFMSKNDSVTSHMALGIIAHGISLLHGGPIDQGDILAHIEVAKYLAVKYHQTGGFTIDD